VIPRSVPGALVVELERWGFLTYLADLGAAWEGSSETPAVELVPSIYRTLEAEA